MGLIESAIYKRYYLSKQAFVLDSNNKVISVTLSARFRVKNTYLRDQTLLENLGWSTTPPSSSDTPPKTPSIINYVSLNAASRNGWINEVGWVMGEFQKQSAPTGDLDEYEWFVDELGDTYRRVNGYKASTWYDIKKDLKSVANAIYATLWKDPYNEGSIYYKADPASVHEIKHRKSTSYF